MSNHKTTENFNGYYGKKPIFGMIHLANSSVETALTELAIYEEEGLSGAIVENYHAKDLRTVEKTLEAVQGRFKRLKIGINILPNEFSKAFEYARTYRADFIQLDHVSGIYEEGTIDRFLYGLTRVKYCEIDVFGGVHPKYYTPVSNLASDLQSALYRADAIVVTGEGTGKETPMGKIRKFRETIGNHPLIVGAGLNILNIKDQLSVADAGIVGSAFKPENDTAKKVDRHKVRDFMFIVNELRLGK